MKSAHAQKPFAQNDGIVITPVLRKVAQLFAKDTNFRQELFDEPVMLELLRRYGLDCTPEEVAVIKMFISNRQVVAIHSPDVKQGELWWLED